jgi:HPt (histidine-containing phosphotransfer) domain-containing protein
MFLANGFDGYISKPIDIRQLNETLNKFIRDKGKNRFESRETAPVQDEKIPEIHIPGIDAEAGLSLYEGDLGIYLPALRSYIPNAQANIAKIRQLLPDGAPSTDGVQELPPNYAILVHGLKGISANIGAENLRQAASELEMMAKAGNLAGVLAKNGAMLDTAETLVTNIITWLQGYDGQHPKPLQKAPDRVLLAKLRECCEAYDMQGIDNAMDELEGINYEEETSLVAWLRETINNLDFSAAASRLSEYLEESK